MSIWSGGCVMRYPTDKRRGESKLRGKKIVNRIIILDVILFIFLCSVIAIKKDELFEKITYSKSIKHMEEQGYPQGLIELYKKNPEARDFVKEYDNYAGGHPDVCITEQLTSGRIPLFLQWDKRWGYESYGNGIMAVDGCGPVSLSMVYCGLTGRTDKNPYIMAQKSVAEGFYDDGCSGSSWKMMDEMASEIGLKVLKVGRDKESIMKELKSGHPIICNVGPGDFTKGGHFIVLTGTDENGGITVNDPNSLINSKKTWDINTLIPQIQSLWAYCY